MANLKPQLVHPTIYSLLDIPLFTSKRPDISRGHVEYAALSGAWRRLLKRAGYTKRSEGVYIYHFQTLRKFFRTFSGLDADIRERLMGHKGKYLDESYFRPPEKDLLEAYRESIPNLTIMEKEREKPDEVAVATMLGVLKGLPLEMRKPVLEQLRLRVPVERRVQLPEEVREALEPLESEEETNGGIRQETIKPENLEEYLKRGYLAKF